MRGEEMCGEGKGVGCANADTGLGFAPKLWLILVAASAHPPAARQASSQRTSERAVVYLSSLSSLSVSFRLTPSIHPSGWDPHIIIFHQTDNVHLPTHPPATTTASFPFPYFTLFHHQQHSVTDSDGGGGGGVLAADGPDKQTTERKLLFYSYSYCLFFRLWLFFFFRACLVFCFVFGSLLKRGGSWSGGNGRTDGRGWFGLVWTAAARRRFSFLFLFSSLPSFFLLLWFLVISLPPDHSYPYPLTFFTPPPFPLLFFFSLLLLVDVGVVSAVYSSAKNMPRSLVCSACLLTA